MVKAIEVLLDHQYVIQSADSSLGIISFSKVFQGGNNNPKHIVKIEGSMLVTPQANGTALIRMLIHQEWMDTRRDSLAGVGVETDTDEGYYMELLEDLTQRTGRVKP
jgi:hypothetical protein